MGKEGKGKKKKKKKKKKKPAQTPLLDNCGTLLLIEATSPLHL